MQMLMNLNGQQSWFVWNLLRSIDCEHIAMFHFFCRLWIVIEDFQVVNVSMLSAVSALVKQDSRQAKRKQQSKVFEQYFPPLPKWAIKELARSR